MAWSNLYWGGKASGVPAIFFLIFRPEMRQKMKQPSAYPLGGHADGCALHQSFHSIFGAVVVCHFRVCNPIFHTPFLHHFGVEQYRITWSYIAAICAGNTMKSRIIGIYRVTLRYRIRWIALDTKFHSFVYLLTVNWLCNRGIIADFFPSHKRYSRFCIRRGWDRSCGDTWAGYVGVFLFRIGK